MPLVRFGDVAERMQYVDEPDVLERMKGDNALALALSISRPRNWWGIGILHLVLETRVG